MTPENTKSKEKLIEAATGLFQQKGYENVTVQEICKQAGVSRSCFYVFFSGKGAILTGIMQNVGRDIRQAFPDFLSAPNDYERLMLIINSYLSFCEKYGFEIIRVLCIQELTSRARNLTLSMAFWDPAVQLIRNCQKNGIVRNMAAADQLARISFHICRSEMEEWVIEKGRVDLKQRVRQQCEALFDVAPEYRANNSLQPLH